MAAAGAAVCPSRRRAVGLDFHRFTDFKATETVCAPNRTCRVAAGGRSTHYNRPRPLPGWTVRHRRQSRQLSRRCGANGCPTAPVHVFDQSRNATRARGRFTTAAPWHGICVAHQRTRDINCGKAHDARRPRRQSNWCFPRGNVPSSTRHPCISFGGVRHGGVRPHTDSPHSHRGYPVHPACQPPAMVPAAGEDQPFNGHYNRKARQTGRQLASRKGPRGNTVKL